VANVQLRLSHPRPEVAGDKKISKADSALEVGFRMVMSIVRLTYLKLQRHLVLGVAGGYFVRPIRPDDEFLIRDLLAT
jgi:hypothetical protein